MRNNARITMTFPRPQNILQPNMIKNITIFLLLLATTWQILRINILHKEVNCISRIECNYCQPKARNSVIKNYFSILDSIENPSIIYSAKDQRNESNLTRDLKIKSTLDFRPHISDVVKDDSCTSFNINIGQFKKITDGYIYHKGLKRIYNSDQCLPIKYDSLVAYWVDDVTGQRKKIMYP